MKLIVIYGTPAAGKFTVAKELSKITGFKLLHNHLTFDLVRSVLEKEDDFFWRQIRILRLEMIRIASEKNVDVIMTTCYAGEVSDKFIIPLIEEAKKLKIKTYFVQLYCDKKELMKRVKSGSRKQFRKLRSVKGLKKNLEKFGHDVSIPHVKSLRIDNTSLHPKKAAKIIKEEYKL